MKMASRSTQVLCLVAYGVGLYMHTYRGTHERMQQPL